MTTPDTSLYATTAQAVIDSAQRQGLTWRLIPGSVVSVNTGGMIVVLLDGDDTVLSPAQSLLAPAPVIGDRVLVLVVPPQGNYVIGYYGVTPETPRLIDRVDSISNSAAVTAETTVLSSNFITFKANRAYKIVWAQRLDHSAAQQALVRVRQNSSGAQAIFWQFQVAGIAGNFYDYAQSVKIGAADVSDALDLSIQATAGTVTARGAADSVRYIEIYDNGPASMFPNAFTLT